MGFLFTAFTLLFVLVLLLALFHYVPFFLLKQRLKKLEGKGHVTPPLLSPQLPFLGHSLELMKDSPGFFKRNHKVHPKAFGFMIQDELLVSLDMDTYAKEYYSRTDVDFEVTGLPEVLPLGSIASCFPRLLRTAIPSILKEGLPDLQRALEEFFRKEMPDDSKGYRINIQNFCRRMDSVFNLQVFMGMSYEGVNEVWEDVMHLYGKSYTTLTWAMLFPRAAAYFRKKLSVFRPAFEKMLLPRIAKRRQEIEQGKEEPRDFLRALLTTKNEYTDAYLTDEQVLHELFISIQAGGSVASSMADVLYRIVQADPKYLQKLQEEQRVVVEACGNQLTPAALDKMPYLDAAIKETLRLEFTFASFRRASTDVVFNDGLVIPKGTVALMTQLGVNWHESYFPDPDRWDPDRFYDSGYASDEETSPSPSSTPSTTTSLPPPSSPFVAVNHRDSTKKDAFVWGAGRHPCPGRKHSLHGLKVTTVLLLRLYSLTISLPSSPPPSVPLALATHDSDFDWEGGDQFVIMKKRV